MTHQNYTQTQLETKNRTELWVICKQRGLKCYPKSADCIRAILEAQPHRHLDAGAARLRSHPTPQSCLGCPRQVAQEIENNCTTSNQKVLNQEYDCTPSNQKVGEELSNYTLEPVGKTDRQIAYVVRENGLMIGLIFQLGAIWQCGDRNSYENSVDAIAGLKALTSAAKVVSINQTQMEVNRVNNKSFSILSNSGKTYTVAPYSHTPRDRCNRPDSQHRGRKCKHQIAVEELIKSDTDAIEHKLDELITKYPWLLNRTELVATLKRHIYFKKINCDWSDAVIYGIADIWLAATQTKFDENEIAAF
jgi:hypothetical protein